MGFVVPCKLRVHSALKPLSARSCFTTLYGTMTIFFFISAQGNEMAAAPKTAPAVKLDPPLATGEKEELSKDEILRKNREEFFKKRLKGGEKSK